MNYNLLFVDDEPEMLNSYQRSFRKLYDISVAPNGEEAINILKSGKTVHVILSDFKMPKMNGVEFLSKAKEIQPNAVRILITGFADLQTSITAVNEGNIFRFLTKPISVENLNIVIQEAINQYKLLNLEKELLDKTLKGSLKILIDILSIVQPIAFKQAKLATQLAVKISENQGVKNLWEVEIATLLSQIGTVAVPQDILEKKYSGKLLSEKEEAIYNSIPNIGANLISKIPYFERVAKIISYQDEEKLLSLNEDNITIKIARIIKTVNDFDMMIKKGIDINFAFKTLGQKKDLYSLEIIKALEQALIDIKNKEIIEARNQRNAKSFSMSKEKPLKIALLPLDLLKAGMVLIEPITDSNGNIILNKGYELNDLIINKLKNIATVKEINQKFKVKLFD